MGAAPPTEPDLPELNLTPMIDVVFQLVIFLMMANDMTRREIAELELPAAATSTEDSPSEGRLTVNLLPGPADRPPSLLLRGEVTDIAGLEAALRVHLASRGGGAPPSILLRADRTCPWRHVQLVLQACAGREIEIRRVAFAAVAPAIAAGKEKP